MHFSAVCQLSPPRSMPCRSCRGTRSPPGSLACPAQGSPCTVVVSAPGGHLTLPMGWEILWLGASRPAEMCLEDAFSALKALEDSKAASLPTNSTALGLFYGLKVLFLSRGRNGFGRCQEESPLVAPTLAHRVHMVQRMGLWLGCTLSQPLNLPGETH